MSKRAFAAKLYELTYLQKSIHTTHMKLNCSIQIEHLAKIREGQ